jgi:hypothetical protein
MIDDEDDGGDMMSLIIHGRLYGGVIPSAQLAIRMAELVLEGAEGLSVCPKTS